MGSKRNQRMFVTMGLAFLISTGGNARADFTFGTPTNLGPVVNSSSVDAVPNISADGLSLFFGSRRPGGLGSWGIWVATRATTDDDSGEPVNIGTTVSSSAGESTPNISTDGLTLYFGSLRSGGFDMWMTTRPTRDDDWGAPVKLGPTVNTSGYEGFPSISADGLELYFDSDRPGDLGGGDIWMSTRESKEHPWLEPVHLGPTVNSSSLDASANISSDGLALFFQSNRPGGYGGPVDIWVAMRATIDDDWNTPVNLGPMINTSGLDAGPCISADGSTLYFASDRPGGHGGNDLWQVSIDPVVDLNGDGIVDAADMCIIVDFWGTDEPFCDIGPMPWGDGIVDVQDLTVLSEHLFEEVPPGQ
jgi:Tol biopolymer transport system component